MSVLVGVVYVVGSTPGASNEFKLARIKYCMPTETRASLEAWLNSY